MKSPFSKVLVANRGEIALRILRTVHALGYRSVAVCSEADLEAPFVRAADESVVLGPAPAAQSYLDVARVIAAAKATGADAIHPGYGFLSEREDFAAACAQAGIVFIGPGAEAIRLMGDKRLAKERMQTAGVPCVPGYLGRDDETAELASAARRIGYPVMIKAANGGGGRGMRLVADETAFDAAARAARSEALNAFGDGALYLEKAITGARHVEIQVMADRHGNVIHLGERDCSIQRRHQKLIEEAPSPAVDEALRQRMGEAAVRAAAAIGYEGAGTVEFLLDRDGVFHFIEMNTRLQVEHPVTEAITGLDLVALQLRIAAGEPLGLRQEDVRFEGHAIEARLNAEDADADFLPQTGTVHRWLPACGAGIRVDAALAEGVRVTSHYDSMLGKVIAHGRDRDEALRRLDAALERTVLLGCTTNKQFLRSVLREPVFVHGEATIDFIEGEFRPAPDERANETLKAAAALLLCWPQDESAAAWRQAGRGRWRVEFDDGSLAVVARDRQGNATAKLGARTVRLEPFDFDGSRLRCAIDGVVRTVHACRDGDELHLEANGACRRYVLRRAQQAASAQDEGERVLAPISGSVARVDVAIGDVVQKDQCVVVLEAMKMQMELRARTAGTIVALDARVGGQVPARHVLARIDPVEATEAAETPS